MQYFNMVFVKTEEENILKERPKALIKIAI